MIDNLITGSLVIGICMIIQSASISVLLQGIIRQDSKQEISPTFLRISTVLVLGVFVLLIGSLIQISIWAAVFMYYDEFTAFKDAFYHSTVNFTTLGYGDFILSNERKLLGGLEAVNGILMFGLSSGFLYMLLDALLRRKHGKRN
ncbi:MAG: potassium channel family protein [Flavobacteriaceae bacterium]